MDGNRTWLHTSAPVPITSKRYPAARWLHGHEIGFRGFGRSSFLITSRALQGGEVIAAIAGLKDAGDPAVVTAKVVGEFDGGASPSTFPALPVPCAVVAKSQTEHPFPVSPLRAFLQ